MRIKTADPLLWLLTLGAALLYGGLSIAAYNGYNTGMLDLGNMSQALWTTLHGRPLEISQPAGSYSRLGGHAEIIYLLLAPLYALWDDPRTLLAAQATLMALGALPVYRLALRRLGSRYAARAFALVYLLYPTAVSAVLFDFHGDTLAMPLLLFALDALDQAAWRRYACFIALSLLCKVYIAAPVALLGLALLSPARAPYPAQGAQPSWTIAGRQVGKAGLLTLIAALAYGVVVFFGVRAIFAPADSALAAKTSYLTHYFGAIAEITPIEVVARLVSGLAVLAPSALLWLWAPRAFLPASAILIPALISTGPAASYDFRYHHYAAAVPFIIAASILGAQRRAQARRKRPAAASATLALLLTALMHLALNDTPLGMSFWRANPGEGLDPSGYASTQRDQLKDQWLARHVPPELPVAASNFLAGHLTNRYEIYLLRYPSEARPSALQRNIERVELVVVDALQDYYVQLPGGYGGGVLGESEALSMTLSHPDFGLVAEQDGLLLFRRGASSVLEQQARQTSAPPEPAQRVAMRFGDAIELAGYGAEQLPGGLVRLELHWRQLRPFSPGERYFAVSTLSAPDGQSLRFPHLATIALLPPNQWRAGETVIETRTLALPEGAASSYSWSIGWYNPAHPRAAQSAPEALISGSQQQLITTLRAQP